MNSEDKLLESVYARLVERFGEPLKEEEDKLLLEPDHNNGNEKVEEIAPPKFEKIVKALKKQPKVKNPWAVAWNMKNKGVEPKK